MGLHRSLNLHDVRAKIIPLGLSSPEMFLDLTLLIYPLATAWE